MQFEKIRVIRDNSIDMLLRITKGNGFQVLKQSGISLVSESIEIGRTAGKTDKMHIKFLFMYHGLQKSLKEENAKGSPAVAYVAGRSKTTMLV